MPKSSCDPEVVRYILETMKSLSALFIGSLLYLSLNAQSSDLIKETKQLILKTFEYTEYNPMYKAEFDTLDITFKEILNRRNKSNIKSTYDAETEKILKRLYNNAICIYEDAPDIRRWKIRRTYCFASLALISDYDKACTFLELAKLSIVETIENPDDDLMEHYYLGILFIEALMKLEEGRLHRNHIQKIESYIALKKDMISENIYQEALKLISKYKKLQG